MAWPLVHRCGTFAEVSGKILPDGRSIGGILQIVQSNDAGLVCVNAFCMKYLADESFLGELRSPVDGWREVMNSLLSSIHLMICSRIERIADQLQRTQLPKSNCGGAPCSRAAGFQIIRLHVYCISIRLKRSGLAKPIYLGEASNPFNDLLLIKGTDLCA